MGSGVSSGSSIPNPKVSEPPDNAPQEPDTTQENYSYHFDTKGIKFTKTPLAYRDADGKVKLYADGAAPTVLVPKVEGPTKKGTDDDPTRATASPPRSEDAPSPQSGDDAGNGSRPCSPDYDKPRPPRVTRRQLIPDEEAFRLIDEHSVTSPAELRDDMFQMVNYLTQSPAELRDDMFQLVDYLTQVTCSPLEHVRAFYTWITHNINYDTSGYFSRAPLRPTDATSVLKTRVTTCTGYTELMEAFCSLVHIPVKTINGYVKAYGYQPGEDVTSDRFNAHAWNAVFINNEWRLMDPTWGAGFVKSRERSYVAMFNEVYFLTDPHVFITDHFPYISDDPNYSQTWQLLEKPLERSAFNQVLNMDKFGKSWGLETVSHKDAIISDVQYDIDVVLKETFTRLSDYVAFLFMDGKKLAQYAYVYKCDGDHHICKRGHIGSNVNIHVRFPVHGEIVLQLYGRRATDDKSPNLQPLLKYILNVTGVHSTVTPYPLNHTVYGPLADFQNYGVSDVGEFHHVTETGEVTISVKPNRAVDLIPKLQFGDHMEDIKRFVFMNYSENLDDINIHVRMPFKGNYKMTLFSNVDGSTTFKPFMTYLLENKAAICNDVFPIALAHSVKYKCRLCEPLTKAVPSNAKILFKFKSKSLAMLKIGDTYLGVSDGCVFSGIVETPSANSDLRIFGAEVTDGVFHPLFIFNTV